MQRKDFHFDLPQELIAQHPPEARGDARMLALDGESGRMLDLNFRDLAGRLDPRDLLVFNDTRVLPARVRGTKESGGRVELLLERVLGPRAALVHVRSSKPLRAGVAVCLPGGHSARLLGRQGDLFRVEFSCEALEFFESFGEVPLPPYIARAPEDRDRERYQTVYAREPGAVAAPTAGLHFDAGAFAALERRGVSRAFVTLHVGAGTFQPVREEDIERHEMHSEQVVVTEEVCAAVAAARAAGGKVVAVGTTVVRSLETAAAQSPVVPGRGVRPYRGATRLFIRPGFRFRVVDALLTNFHLPESTLLMLCAAFVGREPLLAAYAHAVEARYRFFSYGDAMLLTPRHAALSEAGGEA